MIEKCARVAGAEKIGPEAEERTCRVARRAGVCALQSAGTDFCGRAGVRGVAGECAVPRSRHGALRERKAGLGIQSFFRQR